MHGLVHKGLGCFVSQTFGPDVWRQLCAASGQPEEIETFATYDDDITTRLLFGASTVLDRPKKEILEDFGTYLVTSEQTQALRRLMRFGGDTFFDFLDSLDDLPGRVRLALNDLDFPDIAVTENAPNAFLIDVSAQMPGFAFVLVGMLRALADDYGALAEIDHIDRNDRGDTLSVNIHDVGFGQGREFALVGNAG